MASSLQIASQKAASRRAERWKELTMGQTQSQDYFKSEAYVEESYPSWEIETVQPAIKMAFSAGLVKFSLLKTRMCLDVGCGSGYNSVYLASQKSLSVTAVDISQKAVALARGVAESSGSLDGMMDITIACGDVLYPVAEAALKGKKFEVIVDCAFYHSLSAGNQQAYLKALDDLADFDAQLVLLCYMDPPRREADAPEPRRVTQEEIRMVFGPDSGWRVEQCKPARFLDRKHGPDGAPAWLAIITRMA